MHPQLNELIAHLAQLRGQRLGALLTLQVQLVPDLQEFLQAPTGEVLESRVVIHLIGSVGSGAFCCDAGRGGWGPDVLCLNIPPGPVCGRSSAPGASMSRKRSGPNADHPRGCDRRTGQASSVSSRRLRVRFTSTGMPGPLVVATVMFERKRPAEGEAFSRRISSSAAA